MFAVSHLVYQGKLSGQAARGEWPGYGEECDKVVCPLNWSENSI